MLNDKGEEVGIIYGWYCIPTSLWYIGQTIDEEGRFKRHIYNAINKKDNTHFHRAIRKYGLENFVYCVLEENILRENLNLKEIEWIEEFDSFYNGYNLTLGGGGTVSRVYSEETRMKLSESHKGQIPWNKGKHGLYSEETRMKLSESHKGQIPWNKGKLGWCEGSKNGMYGKHHTEESKRKMSESSKKQIGPHNGFYGKHHTEESKRKMSEAHKNLPGLQGSKNGMYGKPAANRRKVIKYDLNGNFIQEYDSIKEAKKNNTKCSGIIAACKGISKQAGGFIWKYA